MLCQLVNVHSVHNLWLDSGVQAQKMHSKDTFEKIRKIKIHFMQQLSSAVVLDVFWLTWASAVPEVAVSHPFLPARLMEAKDKQTSSGFTAVSRRNDACVDFVPA